MARVMTSKEIEAEFGIPAEQLGQWADDAERGVYHGEPRGEVVRGRPLLFGEETRQVGFKEPLGKVELIDRRAEQLGVGRRRRVPHRLAGEAGVPGTGGSLGRVAQAIQHEIGRYCMNAIIRDNQKPAEAG